MARAAKATLRRVDGGLPLPPAPGTPPFFIGVPRRRYHPFDTPPPSAEKVDSPTRRLESQFKESRSKR